VTPADVQATFCATLVDEWVRRGVRHAVVAPGSRSTPMALALAVRPELRLTVVPDERSAAFVALGAGLDGRPAVLLCTSGTAAANFLPAVVEAGLSAVPMLVVTADRPPELRDVGAPQTIDQTHLFGRSVRWFHDPGVADPAATATWRSLARRAFSAAQSGPVHLNLPFREPLLGRAAELPEPLVADESPVELAWSAPASLPGALAVLMRSRRGVIVAGGRGAVAPGAVAALATATGWPVLADPLSGCRDLPEAVGAFDALLRHQSFAEAQRPDVIVRIGRPPSSKVLATWVATAVDAGAMLVQIGGPGVIDPDHRVAVDLAVSDLFPLVALAESVGAGGGGAGAEERSAKGEWRAGWLDASARADHAITRTLASSPELTEPAVARTVADRRPDGARVVVASSMPVRDLEWFGGPLARAHANRGANGIDGVVSTALGVALDGDPTVAVVGDVALLHDAGALTALGSSRLDVRIVVVDNDGGGIFSFLPQATELAPSRFEQLFGTPHGTDIVGVASAHGIDATTVTTAEELAERLGHSGPTLTRVATDRAANVAVHAALNDAVAAALVD